MIILPCESIQRIAVINAIAQQIAASFEDRGACVESFLFHFRSLESHAMLMGSAHCPKPQRFYIPWPGREHCAPNGPPDLCCARQWAKALHRRFLPNLLPLLKLQHIALSRHRASIQRQWSINGDSLSIGTAHAYTYSSAWASFLNPSPNTLGDHELQPIKNTPTISQSLYKPRGQLLSSWHADTYNTFQSSRSISCLLVMLY